MIRVLLPVHLRTLAQVNGEVKLEVECPVTQRSVLDDLRPATRCYGERSVITSPTSAGRS